MANDQHITDGRSAQAEHRRLAALPRTPAARNADIDLPAPILDALSELYWLEREAAEPSGQSCVLSAHISAAT